MPQERSFLDEITANPEYRMARLVYADWLDERGDPRAELIRIEEEMWTTPIWADRYWQLKPRRNELRAGCQKKWLDWMNYGNHIEPVFREVPDGPKERWRLLREFVERWHNIALPDVGGHQDQVAALEEQHGVTFPLAFREWIAFGEDLTAQGRFEQVMRDDYDVDNLLALTGVPVFSLMQQAEGDLYYAVRKQHLHTADPPVSLFVRDDESEDDVRFVHQEAAAEMDLTAFVLGHIMIYLRNGASGSGMGIGVTDPTTVRRQLAEVFPVQTTFDGFEIFERQDMIALLGRSAYSSEVCLWLEAARSLSREEVPAFLWDYTRVAGSFHGLFTPQR